MAISKARIQSDLQPYLLTRIEKSVIDMLTDEDYLLLFNNVANDLNEEADLNMERFYKVTGADTAEDDDYTNYLVQGVISRIYEFLYYGTDYETQAYGFANDRFFFKTAPATGVQLDVHYLRQCEDVSALTDEIDLPSQVLNDYLELLKVKLRVDYGDADQGGYEQALQYYGEKARKRVKNHYLIRRGVKRYWMGQTGDDGVYDISGQWIGLDNFITDANSNYVYSGD